MEILEISLKIGFSFPSRFFFSMMIPLNFEHLDSFPSMLLSLVSSTLIGCSV
jgi:hypothetical protein